MGVPVNIAGWTSTGRTIAAPALDVVELVDGKGLKHFAFAHRAPFDDHPSIRGKLSSALPFMENPEVTGVARLVGQADGNFVYPTGTVWTVAEIVRLLADNGDVGGVKAGLELCYVVAEALTDATDIACQQGVYSHGNLNPWTIAIKKDGQPIVLGYGLPQVEILEWLENPRNMPSEDSFRYAPPERLEGHEEDLGTDIFTLALVALEVMIGKPVYDGLRDDIHQQAARGEGMRRLYQWRDRLPANVREVIGRALKPDPDTRWSTGLDFVYAVHDLLGSIDVEGPSLMEVMAKVRGIDSRGLLAPPTGELDPEMLKELTVDFDSEMVLEELPPPRRSRPAEEEPATNVVTPKWGSVVRGNQVRGDGRRPSSDSIRKKLKSRLKASKEEPGLDDLAIGSEGLPRLPVAAGPDSAQLELSDDDLIREPEQEELDLLDNNEVESSLVVPLPQMPTSPPDEPSLSRPRRRRRQGAPPPSLRSSRVRVRPATLSPDGVSRRRRRHESIPDNDEPKTLTHPGAAAALLEELRKSDIVRSRLRPAARRMAPEPNIEQKKEPTQEDEPPVDLRSTQRGRVQKEPTEPTLPPSEEVSEEEVTDPPQTTASFRTVVVDGGIKNQVMLDSNLPIGTAATVAAVSLGLFGVNALGQMEYGWRLSTKNSRIPPESVVGDIKGELILRKVPNPVVQITIEVQSPNKMRFRMPVGRAVPVDWLVGHVKRWLDLHGLWSVEVGGRVVAAGCTVADTFGEGDEVVLNLVPMRS